MNEQIKLKLKEISLNNKGYYGIGASACDFNSEFPQYLRITDIDDYGNIPNILPTSIDINEYPDYYKYFLKKNDVVLARTGNSAGRNYFYDGDDNKIVYAGFLIKFSISHPLVFPKYLKYYLQSSKYWNSVNEIFTGSTRPNVNAEQYGNLELSIPSLAMQQHIVNTTLILLLKSF